MLSMPQQRWTSGILCIKPEKYGTFIYLPVMLCYPYLVHPIFPSFHWHGCNHICWRHQMETFPRYWLFLREIYRSSVTSLHKGQWRGALMFYLICAWINRWVNNCEAGDLIRHRTHCDVIVMLWLLQWQWSKPDLHGYIMLPNHNKPKQNSNHVHNSHKIIYLKQYDLHWFHSPLFHSILNNIFPTKSPVETSSVQQKPPGRHQNVWPNERMIIAKGVSDDFDRNATSAESYQKSRVVLHRRFVATIFKHLQILMITKTASMHQNGHSGANC